MVVDAATFALNSQNFSHIPFSYSAFWLSGQWGAIAPPPPPPPLATLLSLLM